MSIFSFFKETLIKPVASACVPDAQLSDNVTAILNCYGHPPLKNIWSLYDHHYNLLQTGDNTGVIKLVDLTNKRSPFRLELVVTDGYGETVFSKVTFTVMNNFMWEIIADDGVRLGAFLGGLQLGEKDTR